MVMDHSHEVNSNAFLNLSQQRKMNDSVSMYIVSYIAMLHSAAKSDIYAI